MVKKENVPMSALMNILQKCTVQIECKLFKFLIKVTDPQYGRRSTLTQTSSHKRSCPSWPEAMSYRSPRFITGRDQNGFYWILALSQFLRRS